VQGGGRTNAHFRRSEKSFSHFSGPFLSGVRFQVPTKWNEKPGPLSGNWVGLPGGWAGRRALQGPGSPDWTSNRRGPLPDFDSRPWISAGGLKLRRRIRAQWDCFPAGICGFPVPEILPQCKGFTARPDSNGPCLCRIEGRCNGQISWLTAEATTCSSRSDPLFERSRICGARMDCRGHGRPRGYECP
jgi:hypothetical protein